MVGMQTVVETGKSQDQRNVEDPDEREIVERV
jgi:hypothetical protein